MTDDTADSQAGGMRTLVAEIEHLSGGRHAAEKSFGDERWDYRQGFDPTWSADRWFLHFLSWGPWSSTWNIWLALNREYSRVGRPIGRLSESQAATIVDRGFARGGHNFQRTVRGYLLHLNEMLGAEGFGMHALEQRVRNLGWRKGREFVRKSCGVSQNSDAKVLDCWIRDRLRLFSFPVDTNVRKVVTSSDYRLTDDPCELVELVRGTGRNPRFIARATWFLSEELL